MWHNFEEISGAMTITYNNTGDNGVNFHNFRQIFNGNYITTVCDCMIESPWKLHSYELRL